MKHFLGQFLFMLMAAPLSAETFSSGTIGNFTITPEPGPVEEIESIDFTFKNLGFNGLSTSTNPTEAGVTLTCSDGTVYNVVKFDLPEDDDFNYNTCVMQFAPAGSSIPVTISSPGEYTLTIPENTFVRNRKPDYYNDLFITTYTIAGSTNSLTDFTLLPPADSPVSSLSKITVTFPEAEATGIFLCGSPNDIKLISGTTEYICVKGDVTSNTLSMQFARTTDSAPEAILRPGKYILLIPKGLVGASGTEESNRVPVQATFTVENSDFNSMAEVTTTPGRDSFTESFTAVMLTFPDASYGIDLPADLSGIKLRINDTDTDYIACNPQIKAPYNNISFNFSATKNGEVVTFSEAGKYEVVIPAGIFSESNDSPYKNEAISLPFYVGRPEDNPFYTYTVTPENGATTGEIYELSITFPNLGEDGIHWPFEYNRITLQRVGDETVYTGNSAMLSKGKTVITGFGTEGNTMSDKLHFRTPGEYLITIPAGIFHDESDVSISNLPITLRYTVDPAYNFTTKLTPASGTIVAELPEIRIAPADVLTEIGLNDECPETAILIYGDTEIALSATADEQGVLLTPTSGVGLGEWELIVPAGMLTGVNTDNLHFVNAEPINARYTVKTPQTYTYTTTPADGETIPGFTKFTVSVGGSPKKLTVNTDAGDAELVSGTDEYKLVAKVSGSDVMFAIAGGAALPDGIYRINIPAGYIITTDSDKLTADMDAINTSFTIRHPEASDYDEGMFIYNEGWYGHDMASFTHISNDGTPRYFTFADVNPTHPLGLTGTVAVRFGDKLYAVAKQGGSDLSGNFGGILTQIDGASMSYIDAVGNLEKSEQGRSFCGVSPEKGYLSTSAGIYPVDLTTMTLGERFAAVETSKVQHGSMLRYQGRVFATAKNWDLIVISPEDDSIIDIPTGPAVQPFVTADGSMYVATLDEAHEFYRVNPVNLNLQAVELKRGDYEGRTRIADIWTTWTATPLAVDKTENVVYYATTSNASSIARLNLDNGEFTPDFITLPATEAAQTILYGQGISVDPRSGEILLTAVEKGYGNHYTQNFIYRADPATGKILNDKTLKLSEYYWFPSMIVYSGYEAPIMNFSDINMADVSTLAINPYEHTSLKLGNKSLIEYNLSSSDSKVCMVTRSTPHEWIISKTGEGTATITVTADFDGLVSTTEFTVGTSGITGMESDATCVDVYTPSGILILHNADKDAIKTLAPGIYIAGGKKICIK